MPLRREVSARRVRRLSMPQAPASALSDGVVVVRAPLLDDAVRLAEFADNRELDGRWVGGPNQGSDSVAWASEIVADWIDGWTESGSDDGPALIVDERSAFVGLVSFVPLRDKAVEVIYGVHPQHRRRGIASRALKLVSNWILADTPFSVVELKISEDNEGSLLVARNAGFAFVERFETFVTGTGQTHVDHLFTRENESISEVLDKRTAE